MLYGMEKMKKLPEKSRDCFAGRSAIMIIKKTFIMRFWRGSLQEQVMWCSPIKNMEKDAVMLWCLIQGMVE